MKKQLILAGLATLLNSSACNTNSDLDLVHQDSPTVVSSKNSEYNVRALLEYTGAEWTGTWDSAALLIYFDSPGQERGPDMIVTYNHFDKNPSLTDDDLRKLAAEGKSYTILGETKQAVSVYSTTNAWQKTQQDPVLKRKVSEIVSPKLETIIAKQNSDMEKSIRAGNHYILDKLAKEK